ncbi:MAG: hypothetical protein GWN00_36480 [Aliifodinibius sp.]|nr:HAMP domain-containing histidine kinase [Fodinibius sp.]NIW49972.1 hypothetical protein [Gammaproteobacteria bacterium]NIX00867.1 hypothetical protein [Phycisphaerae bacterium]NIY30088.1 hypothetical protein [Fodinibius sp.]
MKLNDASKSDLMKNSATPFSLNQQEKSWVSWKHINNSIHHQLSRTITELKRNDKLRRELFAYLCHDLRSPLASIRAYIETIFIKDEELSKEDIKKYLHIVLDNALLLDEMIDKMLQLSALEAQQIKVNLKPFSIAELANHVAMRLSPRAEKLKIDLKFIIPPNLPRVCADSCLIERVIINLTENALQHTPADGIVKITLSKHNKKVRVTISDTGCGIAEEDLPYVFDQFYRVERECACQNRGTGLGLAFSKKILHLHNSYISVKSRINEGTTFYFDLNIFDADTSRS